MIKVILGWAAIILWFATPFLLATLIVSLAVGGIAILVRGLAAASVPLIAGGLITSAAAGLAGYLTLIWLAGPKPIMPALVIAEPRAHWTGLLPEIWVESDKYHASVASQLLSRGAIRRVLSPYPANTLPADWYTMAENSRKAIWEEAKIRPGPECAAAFADTSRVKEQVACVEYVRLLVPEGRLAEPHILVEKQGSHPNESISYYLVSGKTKQLIASCSAQDPKPRHPMVTYWANKTRSEVWAAFYRCKREAQQGKVIAAVDRSQDQ